MDIITSTCENCKTAVQQSAAKCPSCGFPVGGTDVQKEIFYHQLGSKKESLKNLEKKIYNARVTLWIVSGLTFLIAIMQFFYYPDAESRYLLLIINTIIAGLFLLLSSYAIEKPFTALIMAAAICLAIFIYGIAEGYTDTSGLLGRILVIILLIRGASNAREAEELKKDLEGGSKK